MMLAHYYIHHTNNNKPTQLLLQLLQETTHPYSYLSNQGPKCIATHITTSIHPTTTANNFSSLNIIVEIQPP